MPDPLPQPQGSISEYWARIGAYFRAGIYSTLQEVTDHTHIRLADLQKKTDLLRKDIEAGKTDLSSEELRVLLAEIEQSMMELETHTHRLSELLQEIRNESQEEEDHYQKAKTRLRAINIPAIPRARNHRNEKKPS